MPRDLEFIELNLLDADYRPQQLKEKLTTLIKDFFQKRSMVVHSYDTHLPVIKLGSRRSRA